MNKRVEQKINQIYQLVYKKVFNNKNLAALANGSRLNAVQTITSIENSVQYEKFAQQFALELAKTGLNQQRGVWRKFYKASQQTHNVAIPKTLREYEANIMSVAIKQNFTMIKSIPNEMMKLLEHDYVSTLIESVAKGSLGRNAFRMQLAAHGHKNAKLIARTETAKLQTTIMETRAKELNLVAYEWVASRDKRTRPSHRDMDGVIVFWREQSQKPLLDKMRGNAGEFPNCRCTPEPIVDESELTDTYYKVYNYHNDKVERWSHKKLIEALQKGEIQN